MPNIIIDEINVAAAEGVSVLDAALDAGIYIPNLCRHPSLEAIGECKLCTVEIGGELVTACTTPAEEGMVVTTKSPEIDHLRKLSLELMLAAHPSECTSCPKYLKCELQSLIQYEEVTDSRLRKLPVNESYTEANPLFVRDLSRCILCGRCVRACEKLRGVGVYSFGMGKSGDPEILIRGGGLMADGDCRFCGACVEVCPTGALMDKKELMDQFPTRAEALVPCRAKCPAGADVPRYLAYIRQGAYDKALCVIREKLTFPLTLGHICMHFCEDACRRGCVNDPVHIKELKRVAAEQGGDAWKQRREVLPDTGKRVAVIGAGPAGLTAAYQLRRKGHSVEVFEAMPEAGGMLRYGIPAYRLPRDVLQGEIDTLTEIGFAIHTNTRVTPAALKEQGFDAIVIAVGAHNGTRLPIEGNDLPGVTTAVDYLRQAELGTAPDLGERVFIIGGGNVAFDAAGTAHRAGTGVTMACLEARDAMTASDEEIDEGLGWGLELHNAMTFKAIRQAGDQLEVVCEKVAELGRDENGRMKIITVPDSEQSFPASSVIFAVGQRPDIGGFGLESNRGLLNGMPADGIFAAGDVVTGTASVVQAVDAGRKIAAAADKFLGGDGDVTETLIDYEPPESYLGRVEKYAYAARGGHVDPDTAQAEAERCLRCHMRLEIEKPKFWNEVGVRA